MDDLQWPLTVLSRAIKYKNLTGASQHIGLSQPQLSRLVAQLEEELELSLLDRSSKRNARWTPVAHKLAEIYSLSALKLKNSISELQEDDAPTQLHVATLEGLADLAQKFSVQLFSKTRVSFLRLDVLDLHDMEAQFLAGEIDLLFTSRMPGKKKYLHSRMLGHQVWDVRENESDFWIASPFEYDQAKNKKVKDEGKVLVSNSLVVRRQWLNQIGGRGQLPGPVSRRYDSQSTRVMAVGADHLKSSIWQIVNEF